MRELILEVIDKAYQKTLDNAPKTKKKMESISIMDVSPLDLVDFMRNNNIPNNAEFGGKDNGYDAWDDIELQWYIDIPTTEKETFSYCERTLDTNIWRALRPIMLENGYKESPMSNYHFSKDLKGLSANTLYHKNKAQLVEHYLKRFSLK